MAAGDDSATILSDYPWLEPADIQACLVYASLLARHERNADFTRKLAKAVHRPAIIPAPPFALKLLLGDFAGVVLASQRAVPRALSESGFRFRFPTLELALADLVGEASRSGPST